MYALVSLFHPVANEGLWLAVGVNVGGVDEVSAQGDVPVQDGVGGLFVQLPWARVELKHVLGTIGTRTGLSD